MDSYSVTSLLLYYLQLNCWLQRATASTDMAASVKYQCTLTAELLKKAEDELNEKAKWRDRDIQALRDMILLHKGI